MHLRVSRYSALLFLAWTGVTGNVSSSVAQNIRGDSGEIIQLFAVPSAIRLTVGDTLSIEVEMFASPTGAGDGLRLARAMNGLGFESAPEFAARIESSLVHSRYAVAVGDTPVHVFARTFSLSLTEPGQWEVPSLGFEIEGRRFSTERFQILVSPLHDFEKYGKSVVPIFVNIRSDVRNTRYRRSGSAFLIRENAIATSYHVILDAESVEVVLPSGQRRSLTRAWSIDPARDVAILYMDPSVVQEEDMVALPMASYDSIVDQDGRDGILYTHGFRRGRRHETLGVLNGPLSGTGWSSTNPVRPGDSGGPLLNQAGQVIGVITSGSVSTPGLEVLREEICVAADPRPALATALKVGEARELSRYIDDRIFGEDPYVRGQRLVSTLLASRRRRNRRLPDNTLIDRVVSLGNDLLKSDSIDVDLLYVKGFLEQLVGNVADAEDSFRLILESSENHFQAAYMLALHHLRKREFAEAKRFFEHTARFDPYYHLALYGLARSEMGLHRYDEASLLLRSVLAFDNSFAPALFDLARIYLTRDDAIPAKQLYVRLSMLNSNWASRLRTIIENPFLAPAVLDEIPLVPVAPLSLR